MKKEGEKKKKRKKEGKKRKKEKKIFSFLRTGDVAWCIVWKFGKVGKLKWVE